MINLKDVFKDLPQKDYNKLEFLDHILNVLYNKSDMKLHFNDINREIYIDSKEDEKQGIFFITADPGDELGKAFKYLQLKGMVSFSSNEVHLTYKGIVKLSFDGFKGKMIRQDKIDQFYVEYLRWTVIIAICVFIVSLINIVISICCC